MSSRITEWLMLERTSGDNNFQPPEAEPLTSGCPGLCLCSFWIAPRMETPQSLWATCTSIHSVILKVKKCFLMLRGNLFCFSLFPLSVVLSLTIRGMIWAPSLGSVEFNTFINSIDSGIYASSANLQMTSSWFLSLTYLRERMSSRGIWINLRS